MAVIIPVYGPVTTIEIVITDDQIDKLIELHAAKWRQPLSAPCSHTDLIMQAIDIGLLDEDDLGGDWCECQFLIEDVYHSSVEQRDES